MNSKTLLIGGIALAILGAILYTNFQKPTVKETTNTTTVVDNQQPENKETTFVVKELGIQFTITEDIKDLVYVTKNNSGRDFATFSTQSLIDAEKKSGGKNCTTLGGPPLGTISVEIPAPAGSAVLGEQIKQFGNKYLYFYSPQEFCSENKDLIPLATKQMESFKQALKSAVLFNQDAQ